MNRAYQLYNEVMRQRKTRLDQTKTAYDAAMKDYLEILPIPPEVKPLHRNEPDNQKHKKYFVKEPQK